MSRHEITGHFAAATVGAFATVIGVGSVIQEDSLLPLVLAVIVFGFILFVLAD